MLRKLDLIIEVTSLYSLGPAAALAVQRTHPLVCDRCHDGEELVIAIMKILPLEQAWSLCGACASKLPSGFKVA